MDGVRIGERTAERLAAGEARLRIDDGTIAGGMALKVRVALDGRRGGDPGGGDRGQGAAAGGSFPGTRIVAEAVSEVKR